MLSRISSAALVAPGLAECVGAERAAVFGGEFLPPRRNGRGMFSACNGGGAWCEDAAL